MNYMRLFRVSLVSRTRGHKWKLAKEKFRTDISVFYHREWSMCGIAARTCGGGRNSGGFQNQAWYGAGYYLAFRQTKQWVQFSSKKRLQLLACSRHYVMLC